MQCEAAGALTVVNKTLLPKPKKANGERNEYSSDSLQDRKADRSPYKCTDS